MMRLALRLALLLAALCVGCGDDWTAGDPTPKPGQDQALQIVWYDAYGMTVPPRGIRWTDTAVENHPEAEGFVYSDEAGGIVIKWDGSFAESVFAHELCHERQRVLTGDVDACHASACFGGINTWDGDPGSLLYDAEAALRAVPL